MDGGQVLCSRGRKRDSVIFHCGDGFHYYVREVRRSRARLQCHHYEIGCRGTASVSLNTGWLHHLQPHNHVQDRLLVADRELRQAIINEVKTNRFGTKIQAVLNDFKLRCGNVRLASRFTTVRMKSSMYRARSSTYPTIPKTLIYLGILLGTPDMRPLCKTVDGTDYIFQGVVGNLSSKTIALIFVSGRMIQFLQTRRKLHSDGTFKKRSKKPVMSQILNIVTKYGQNVIAIVRVLMLRRTTEAYRTVLEHLKIIAPNMNPHIIHSDFERAQMNAWKAAFPNARVVGCIWHYAVAVSSKAHTLGLKNLVEDSDTLFSLVRCLCGVPLLPSDWIWSGVKAIWQEAEQAGWSNELRPLFAYFEREWKPRVYELSVFDAPDRTNNCSESDNHSLANVLPQNRPNIFHLIGGFRKLEHLAWCDKVAIDDGRQVTGQRKWKTIYNDSVVRRATELLMNDEISLAHFLHTASYAIHAAVMHGLRLRRRDNDSESDPESDSE